jgi:predicted amidophosphoribosyltransferase
MLENLIVFVIVYISTLVVCLIIYANRTKNCSNCKEDLNYKNHNCPFCGIDKEYFKK